MSDIEETSRLIFETHTGIFGGTPHGGAQLKDEIINDEARRVMEIIFYVFLTGAISTLGIVANIVNIIIFYKLGFKDPINISLWSLAVVDIGALIPLFWRSVCFNPLFYNSDIPFDYVQIQQITGGWPHVLFVRITSWITVFITLDRCVCVALPLKVKGIISSKRTFNFICTIIVICIASYSPVFCTAYLANYFNVERNRTFVEVVQPESRKEIQNVVFSFNVFAQMFSFLIVMVCTIILIHSLGQYSKQRSKVLVLSSSAMSHKVSARDARVVVMVTSIAVIFIVCFMPNTLNMILMIHLSPAYNIGGLLHNSFIVSRSINNTLEAVNSSISIVVFYNMSSKFRVKFNKLFGCGSSF